LKKITVIVPTYNEAENLPKLVLALFSLPIPELDLLVVDDNSPDGTGQLAEELGKQNPGRIALLHRPGKLGLGSAYIAGFRYALKQGAEAVLQMDADFSHPVEKIPEMVAALKDADVVLGSRYVSGGGLDEHLRVEHEVIAVLEKWNRLEEAPRIRAVTGVVLGKFGAGQGVLGQRQ